jgi:hypothetical protein
MNRLLHTLQNPPPPLVVSDKEPVTGQYERSRLIRPIEARRETALDMVTDDVLGRIYGIGSKISYISGKRGLGFVGRWLAIVSRSE